MYYLLVFYIICLSPSLKSLGLKDGLHAMTYCTFYRTLNNEQNNVHFIECLHVPFITKLSISVFTVFQFFLFSFLSDF